MKCRFCNTKLEDTFIDLGTSPASNSFLTISELDEPEMYYPLKVMVCHSCFLVQVDEYKSHADIFNNDYAYFSSYSKSWLLHSSKYVDMISRRLNLSNKSHVIEIASNDGYLLQYFKEKDIPCLGIEPTTNTAKIATEKGIETIVDFFNVRLAKELVKKNRKADLIIGNNVLAHDPHLNELVEGLRITLKETGVITMEFPHLLNLIIYNQFDTIYHEHFSYFSLYTVKQIFEAQALVIFDVDEIPTHGGSLRIYAKHKSNSTIQITKNVDTVLNKELNAKLMSINGYLNFQELSNNIKYQFLEFLLSCKSGNKTVVGYGAAAKGNTLLNYCGVKTDLISFVVDASKYKQGKYMPGSRIPVVHEQELKELKPDFVIIFPWNIKDEIIEQLHYIKNWGGKFVIPIPKLTIL